MTEPEQWRFQWPDGTWIRWNPQTQAWEKEAAGAEASAESDVAAPAPAQPPVEVVKAEEPDDEELIVEKPPVEEPVARARAVDPEKAPVDVPRVEEPIEALPSRRERRTGRTSRSMARDVLPTQLEPDRPGSSLWPTVITGIVVGIGVGLLIWFLIR